jgi:hypothetical protein
MGHTRALQTLVVSALALAAVGCGEQRLTSRPRASSAPISPSSSAVPGRPTSSTTTVGSTFGPIPEDAWNADGSLDLKRVPAFIPVAGENDRSPGYVRSAEYLRDDQLVGVLDVFGKDLRTVVGHLYPNIGFVPVDRRSEDYPTIPVTIVEDPSKSPSANPDPSAKG